MGWSRQPPRWAQRAGCCQTDLPREDFALQLSKYPSQPRTRAEILPMFRASMAFDQVPHFVCENVKLVIFGAPVRPAYESRPAPTGQLFECHARQATPCGQSTQSMNGTAELVRNILQKGLDAEWCSHSRPDV